MAEAGAWRSRKKGLGGSVGLFCPEYDLAPEARWPAPDGRAEGGSGGASGPGGGPLVGPDSGGPGHLAAAGLALEDPGRVPGLLAA